MLWDRRTSFQRNRPSYGGVRIGDWTFLPDEAAISRGTERRRLENRAAEVLSLLAERRGEVVGSDELIDRIWGGRLVSPNSVAVVIGDLRRAIGDDARVPRFIETIPKRGYRLTANPSDHDHPVTSQRAGIGLKLAAVVAGIGLLVALAFLSGGQPTTGAVPIGIGSFSNQTGDPRFEPLTVSVRELAITALGKSDIVRIERGNAAPRLRLTGRLIMWEGHPAAGLSVDDARTGTVVWTGMAGGPEAAFPRQVPQQMTDLAAKLKTSAGRIQ
jgi:DNA-binding winged helix-turn-helix (wHTH) protein